ncbi:hypothetical protein PHYBLDRAFT_140680 [Phycomyces blakesleeanus NRRL 1555(-)]|uniref:Uncharacterized protein n=1 Tax=Phycomyces blakesleeanus (strain ATCC 8743b / DSM 1359 / FGSC 10004 / NBRC 33097 / NRRL 1555) TaxID=763407 RepID=A0A167PVJ7_PHYB8|nr:hypothetical protein PHYBLDRAFT_140680 [Phycomyces blakesleeanus NRRL 1555(-)]OAD78614.1 hypothetical protein PHYBLDRAFT_140680 [Phycomyces blakesleeanus NRRL 1555(-)]|eukprot:XP_018296654.1 hypothetical protein PHYBLDRAFT_140680 [Phycomyces blakesleeanus NRRL 1555(-)]
MNSQIDHKLWFITSSFNRPFRSKPMDSSRIHPAFASSHCHRQPTTIPFDAATCSPVFFGYRTIPKPEPQDQSRSKL